jgi:hypothetical protein
MIAVSFLRHALAALCGYTRRHRCCANRTCKWPYIAANSNSVRLLSVARNRIFDATASIEVCDQYHHCLHRGPRSARCWVECCCRPGWVALFWEGRGLDKSPFPDLCLALQLPDSSWGGLCELDFREVEKALYGSDCLRQVANRTWRERPVPDTCSSANK